jgi:DNA-directed RNA polymerase subunit RPC12/RpoP
MRVHMLDAHYERQVEVDLCLDCRLVWFDKRESLRLSGLGWIELLGRLQHDKASLAPWAGKPLGCARCRKPLQAQANVTRYGRFVSNRCAAGHGTLQSQALLLAERGLVRGPTAHERAAVAAERRDWLCLNCGGPIDGDAVACSYCSTPVLMYDLPRLADSLRPHAAYRANVEQGRLDAWACRACGQALDPTREASCGQCRHPVLALAADDLRPVLARLEREWQGWKQGLHPVPDAVQPMSEGGDASFLWHQSRQSPRGLQWLPWLLLLLVLLAVNRWWPW